MINSSLIILAGGQSSRMGEDKGLMLFNGKPMILHLIDRFHNAFPELIIVTNNEKYKKFKVPIVKDKHINCGAISGIEAGLSFSNYENNLILTCDNPFIEFSILKHLIEKKESDIVFSYYKKPYPFPGFYSKKIVKKLDALILQGLRKISDLIYHFKVTELCCSEFNAANFINFNTPKDIENWDENFD